MLESALIDQPKTHKGPSAKDDGAIDDIQSAKDDGTINVIMVFRIIDEISRKGTFHLPRQKVILQWKPWNRRSWKRSEECLLPIYYFV